MKPSATKGYWRYAWHCAGYKNPKLHVRIIKAIKMYFGMIP